MNSIFTKIINGEIPSVQIANTDRCIAIMDAYPLRSGHVLVIPKEEVDDFFNLEDSLIEEIMLLSKKIAHAMKQAIPCKRIGMSVVGLEVPHAHVHLIPINSANDINFVQEKMNMPKEELEAIAKQIRQYLHT